MSSTMSDSDLKGRHRAMWASGDYASMVEAFLLPLGPRLVQACAIGPGMAVLDVAAGTGNASLPAAQAGRVDFAMLERDVLEITAFERARDYGEHFKARYGPTIAARANAGRTGRETEFDEALDRFCDEWNRGADDDACFEKEYLLAVGRRA